jgi:hypothetical protein
MKSNNPHILDRLTPAFLGVIWIGSDTLDESIAGFKELNYVFDGLLSHTLNLYTPEQKSKPLSFFTQSFGENFFLYYFIGKVDFPISFSATATENRNKILIITSMENSNHEEIQIEIFKANLPQFQFELLNLRDSTDISNP